MGKLFVTWFKTRAVLYISLMRLLSFVLQVPLYPKVSVGAFIKKGDEYLVIDVTYRSGFAFPGGMIEPGESVEAALTREIKEETGLDVTSCTYLTSTPDIQYGVGVLALVFTASAIGETQASAEGDVRWETAETILQNCSYENWQQAFADYVNQNK